MNTPKPTYNLSALSMAYKAGACMVGEKKVLAHLKDMKVLILACDAGPNISEKVRKKIEFYKIPIIKNWNKEELSSVLPKNPILIGVTKKVFVDLIKLKLKNHLESDGYKY